MPISRLVSRNQDLFKDPNFVISLKSGFEETSKLYENNKNSEMWIPFAIVKNLKINSQKIAILIANDGNTVETTVIENPTSQRNNVNVQTQERVPSTTSGGFTFGQQSRNAPSSFHFGQQSQNSSTASGGFTFGQQSRNASSSFHFGQQSRNASSSFHFGQQSQNSSTASGGFTFGPQPQNASSSGTNPLQEQLFEAVKNENLDEINYAISNGADVNALNNELIKETPFREFYHE